MFDLHSSDARTAPSRPFENAEWRLGADGLEHRATGYFIAREMIAMRRGDLWEWPLHLAEKSWCTPLSFRQAFRAAIEAYGTVVDANLDRSFAVAFGLAAGPGSKAVAGMGDVEDFVALGDFVRPKSVRPDLGRMRGASSETRVASRRGGMPGAAQRAAEAGRQRATLRGRRPVTEDGRGVAMP